MTDPLEAPAPRETSKRGGPARVRQLVVIVVIVLVMVAAGVALVFSLPGWNAINQTGVLLDARPFVCKDSADVTTYTPGDFESKDEAVYVPAVRLHPGLDCTMDVVIRNDSDTDVSVDRITIPLAGPRNGTGVHADLGYMQSITPSGGRDALDAVFDYEHDADAGGSFPIGAHSAQRFSFHLSWSDGCMDNKAANTFTQAPVAVLSVGPWHVAKTWDGAGYAFVGGKNTVAASCGQ